MKLSCIRSMFRPLLLTLLALAFSPATAQNPDHAGNPPQAVTVGVYISPPFVIDQNGHYEGMAVELWQMIAAEEGYASKYRPFPTLKALLAAVEKNEIDVAVTNLTITQDRA